METVRLYRKEPNGDGSPNRYRVAYKSFYTISDPDGKVHISKDEIWTVRVEGEEELGVVFLGSWKSVTERYDVVEELSDSPDLYPSIQL